MQQQQQPATMKPQVQPLNKQQQVLSPPVTDANMQAASQAVGGQNKLFQINKQVILTARKLETGPLENYVHMATLIHKMNLLLLEYDSVKQLRTILRIIFSKALMNSLIDFCMNADQFAHFGVRLLELLSLEYHREIIKSEALLVIFGLLRTQDYETVVQCLSFVKVLLQTAQAEIPQPGQTLIKVGEIMNKKLIVLIMRTVMKTPEIEYIALLVDIINLILPDKDQRQLVFESILKEEDPSTTLIDDEAGPYNYKRLLKQVENLQEIKAVKPLQKKIQRQIREIEMWQNSKKNPAKKSDSSAAAK